MIAEEMDLDPGQFEIRFAGPSPAYFNTGFAEELAPFRASTRIRRPRSTRRRIRILKKIWPADERGSSTVPDTYEKLRVAGAVARDTLKAAAAKRAGVAVADVRTQSGQVTCPTAEKLPTSNSPRKLRRFRRCLELGEAARSVPVADTGKPMTRLDVRSKAMGELKFGIDLKSMACCSRPAN